MDMTSPNHRQAVVVGGSIAGMLAARVLADCFDVVTIVERDRLPDSPLPRRGVPQSAQPHVLFVQGYRILEDLFPGIKRRLETAGAVPIDWAREFFHHGPGGWNAVTSAASELVSFTCCRYLLEWAIRQELLQIANVTVRENSRVLGLLTAGDRVTGVELSDSLLAANLVVDASGRGSNAPHWLSALGYPMPEKTVVDPQLGYATCRYRIPEAYLDAPWKVLLVAQQPPNNPRLGYLARVEGGEWIATLGGYGRHYPPLEESGFLDFARQLASPAFYEAIREGDRVSEIVAHRATANRRYHYDRAALPEGFVAVGDSVCSLCPVYGQGMTVSALSALVLRDWVQQETRQLSDPGFRGQRFHEHLAKCHEWSWSLAVSQDSQFDSTLGAVRADNWLAKAFGGYLQRMMQRTRVDGDLHATFMSVAHLVAPPSTFFHPRVVFKTLRPMAAPKASQPAAPS